MLDAISEVANIAGPGMPARVPGFWGDFGRAGIVLGAELAQESLDETGISLSGLAAAGHRSRRLSSGNRVFRGTFPDDKLFEVAVRCRHDASAALKRPDPSYPLELTILKDAKELDLHERREIPDLIEEQCPSPASSKRPALMRSRR